MCSCCEEEIEEPNPQAPAVTNRVATAVQWATPIAILALIPKCPACVAAYFLLITGVSLSFQTAAVARWTLLAVSIAALGYLVLRAIRRLEVHRAPSAELTAGNTVQTREE